MARRRRIEYPDAWYHVMNRGANRKRIFFKDNDYDLFTHVVKYVHFNPLKANIVNNLRDYNLFSAQKVYRNA